MLLWFGFELDPVRIVVTPTRAVGGKKGELGGKSDSESVNKGESGFGGGKTSPGTVIRWGRCLLRCPFAEVFWLLPVAVTAPRRRVMRAGGLLIISS